jgi:hypothetical protein
MNRPLRPWVKKALTVIITAFVGAFGFTSWTGLEARVTAVEERPIVVAPYETLSPTVTLIPTASPSAIPTVRLNRTVKPTLTR